MRVTPKVRDGILVLMVSQGAGKSKPRSLKVRVNQRYLFKNGTISSKAPGVVNIRKLLFKHQNKLYDIHAGLVDELFREPTLEEILAEYDSWKSGNKVEAKSPYLMDYWEEYSKYRWIKLKQKKSSFKKVDDTENDLITMDRRRRLLLADVGPKMVQKFIDDLHNGRGYSGAVNGNNTVKKKLGEFKRFLGYLKDKGLHNSPDYDAADVDTYEPIEPSYSSEELELIHKLDLSTVPGFRKKHQITKDLYLVCGHTGVSFGDISSINKKNISTVEVDGKEIYVLRYQRNKTTVPATIPLERIVVEILERHNWELPMVANQTANKAIKEIARAAGIKGEHIFVKYVGNERIEIPKPRWAAIKFHSSRSSFTTNHLDSDVPIETVSKMNGQKSTNTTLRYHRPGMERHTQRFIRQNFDKF